MNLSKSRYTQGVTCEKKLWLSCYKPDEAEDGDKYVIYLKEELNGEDTIDVKFFSSVKKEEKGTDSIPQEVTEVVDLPVTFDSGTILFVILGVIIVALIAVVATKKMTNKKEENK